MRRRTARVHVPWDDVAGRSWRLEDALSGDVFDRGGDDIAADGLYVSLAPWGHHVLRWS